MHNRQSGDSVPQIAILGCGNILLGDDGFGPAVIERLLNTDLPEWVQAVDVGTSIREYLIDLLLAPVLQPAHLVVVDATYRDQAAPGTLFWCRPDDLPSCKAHDFSLHQFPTVNLLTELEEETGMEVALLLAQAVTVPEIINPGLTVVMEQAVLAATTLLTQRIHAVASDFSCLLGSMGAARGRMA